ncbi:MAG: DoxX family protein [Deltaproteobacteria bacterium]|nr:DoxX family protein [Deltaproteobacteria bacterium]
MATASLPSLYPSRPRALHAALWIAQLGLAAIFGMAGVMKLATPIAQLAPKLTWTADVPETMVRFIGSFEVAGAIALIVPAATRIRPHLTPVAATGIVILMAFATMFHVSRGELAPLPMTITLGAVAAFVAWGRTMKAPIDPIAG